MSVLSMESISCENFVISKETMISEEFVGEKGITSDELVKTEEQRSPHFSRTVRTIHEDFAKYGPDCRPSRTFLLYGDSNVGKTSLFSAYACSRPNAARVSSSMLFEDYSVDDQHFVLQLKDLCPRLLPVIKQESTRFTHNLSGVFLMFAIDNRESFDNLSARRDEILSYMSVNHIPCVVLANKCDVADDVPIERRVTNDEIQTWCDDNSGMMWYKTSNRDVDMPNMQRAIDELVHEVRKYILVAFTQAKIDQIDQMLLRDSTPDCPGNSGVQADSRVQATANIDIPCSGRRLTPPPSSIVRSDSEEALISSNDSPPRSIRPDSPGSNDDRSDNCCFCSLL